MIDSPEARQDLRKLRVSSSADSPAKCQLERPPPPSPRDLGVISLTTYAEAATAYANVIRGSGDGDEPAVIVRDTNSGGQGGPPPCPPVPCQSLRVDTPCPIQSFKLRAI